MTRAERRQIRVVQAAWLFGIFAFFVPATTWSPASRFALTRALVERGTLSIDAYASSTGDRALVGGEWFTEKAPLPSLVAALPYAALRQVQSARGLQPQYVAHARGQTPAVRLDVNRAFQQGLFISSIFTSALAGVAVGLLAFELLRRRTRGRAALAGSALLALATPLFPYATSFYGHTVAAALLLGALVALDPLAQRRDGEPSPRAVRIAGLCLAAAPGCEYLAAIPAAVIGVWFLWRSRRRITSAIDLALGAALPVLLVGGYHTLVFGVPWRTGYSFIVNPQFKAGQQSGFLGITSLRWAAVSGLTFGTSRGLFYIAPVTLVALGFTLRRAIRGRDSVAAVGLVGLVALFLVNASYFVWWGGAAAGPRHVLPAIGVLALGLGDALRSRNRAVRWGVIALGVVSLANCAVLSAVGIEAPEFENILTRFAWPNALAGRFAVLPGGSNLGQKLGMGPWGTLLVVVWGVAGYVHLDTLVSAGRRRAKVNLRLASSRRADSPG